MSPGHFAGRVRYLDLRGVEIYEEHMNTRVEQNFSAPQGSLAFCFDRSDNALYVLNGESRNIWITPENYQEIAVVFGPEFVQRHALDVARLEGLFMAPLNSQQNALFSRWLSATLTQLSQTYDPPSREALTQQLFDDCLFILDNACICLDQGALQRRAGERAIMKRVGEWAADSPQEQLNLLELSQVAGVHRHGAHPMAAPAPPEQRPPRIAQPHANANHRGRSGDALVVLAPGAVFQQLSRAVQGTAERYPQACKCRSANRPRPALEGRRGNHPDHHRIHLPGIAVAVRFLAGETETVAFIELKVALADPQFEAARQQIAGFFAVVTVALLAVRAGRETRVEHFQLAVGLRGQ
jgi:hypothetical protein